MDPTDVYMSVSAVCMFLAMMAYEAGMVCVPTALCVIGAACVVVTYRSYTCYTSDRPKRRKRKRR